MTPLGSVPDAPRSPWQRLYAAAHARRRERAARAAERLPAPVVSVGNLHWGGTGKTPLVVALGAHLRDRGHRVAVLSRGYRRVSRGPLVVSRGAGPLVTVAAAGDEPHLIARALPGVAVLVGESRLAAGRLALAELVPPPDLFLLDDGFSHVALARDLDLLVLPAGDPWGGGRLWPSGRLREPLASARHADALLVAGGAAGDGGAAAAGLAAFGFTGPGFAAPLVSGAPRFADGAPVPAGARVLAVCGIARPERFFRSAAGAGLALAGTLAFPDHHAFPARSLAAIARRARALGAAAVLTTEKDAAKLEGRLALPHACLPVEARPEPAFFDWLDGRLAELDR